MAFNPQHGTLATVGSDGKYNFWDKNARQKLKHGDQHDLPVSACAINGKGNLFAYSESYDWCQVSINLHKRNIGLFYYILEL